MSADDPRPSVFLAHATEDNDRFARALAVGLNDRGLNVWFDEWELALGDSIVDRIFEDGVPSAEAMVVIVSEASVESRWVREEINAGFIRRIEGRFKLIPVIIDDVPIPGAFKTTFYRRVDDLSEIRPVVDGIIRAVLGERNRPDPGDLPGYAASIPLPDLDRVDSRVLQAAGDVALEANQTLVESKAVLERVAPDGVAENAFLESLEVLECRGYLEVHTTFALGIEGMSAFSFTVLGFEIYADAFVPEYGQLQEQIIQSLTNSTRERPVDVDSTQVLHEHVLDVLAARGLIRITKMSGPMTSVDWVNPELRRMVDR
jgi:hypothetical protein